MTPKFENWKSGRYIVLRNEKGHFITYRKQKGSGIKTKKQAKQILENTGTFHQTKVRIGKKRVKVKQEILSRTKLGKNTIVLRTKETLKKEKHYQYITIIYWGRKRIKTVGYSNIRGTKEESLRRCISGAISLGIIDYDWVVDINNEIAYPPEVNKQAVKFEFNQEVMTYVKAKGKWD